MTDERFEIHRTIPADASAIFDIVSDPRGQVAIDASGMLMDATGERVSASGDTFVVHMDREALNDVPLGKYDVLVTIVAFERDREIAWVVGTGDNPNFGHVYGYRLEPVEGGTVVTSYCDWSAISDDWKRSGRFPIIPEATIRATLGILERTVAGTSSTGGAD